MEELPQRGQEKVNQRMKMDNLKFYSDNLNGNGFYSYVAVVLQWVLTTATIILLRLKQL